MKLAFFDTKTYDMPGFDHCAKGTGLEIKYFETRLNEDTVSLANGYDAVCVFVNDTVNAAVIEKLHSYGVKLLVLRCAGFNNVDIAACQGKIRVFRVPAYSPHAVAEHAMALLLTINRRTHKAYIRTRDFNFSLQGFVGFDLYGKTVGVIGTGKIGRVFADISKGFGMKVIAYDKYPNPATGLKYVSLDELFAQSDIISLHCPGIKEKKVGAACLDVYEEEGDLFYEDYSGHVVQDDTLVRLIAMPNVIVSSHQAFLTQEALDNIAATTVDNVLKFFQGTPNEQTEVLLSK